MRKYVRTTTVTILLLSLCYVLTTLRASHESLILEISIFLIGLVVLVYSASLFTELAVVVGNTFGLSKLATGTLIIAIGTSAPEVFASMVAAFKGQPEIVIGNVYGTVIANSLLGIGFGALFAKGALIVHDNVVSWKLSVFFVSVFLSVLFLYDGVISAAEGVLFIPLLVYYLYFVFKTSSEESDDERPSRNFITIIMLAVSLFALFISADFVVSSLIRSATLLDISGAKLATTILAVGTSIPEIATAIALVRQNNADSLFGEIIGSNIFDILGIFGLASLIIPLTMGSDLLFYLIGSMVVMIIVTGTIMHDKYINKIEGFALILLFVGFTIQFVNI